MAGPSNRNKGNRGKSLKASQRRLMSGDAKKSDVKRVKDANKRALKYVKGRKQR